MIATIPSPSGNDNHSQKTTDAKVNTAASVPIGNPGTGTTYSMASRDQTIAGTHSTCKNWLVALRWSSEYAAKKRSTGRVSMLAFMTHPS